MSIAQKSPGGLLGVAAHFGCNELNAAQDCEAEQDLDSYWFIFLEHLGPRPETRVFF